jgi:N-acetyl sugar amidotransferase
MLGQYRICSRCIMDTTDPDIVFNEVGACNHCDRFEEQLRRRVAPIAERDARLQALVSHIKAQGRGGDYDCVIGVSGGVDSTYVAFLTKQLGLRPLAVHFDNGWNSELAVANIEKAIDRLGIDLSTYVIDWDEFKDLQLSFLKASTPDGEVPTDHAIVALLYQAAAKHGIKHILLGTNVASEAIMPIKWGYGYSDFRYIQAVQSRLGSKKLRSYPHYSLLKLFEYMAVRRIRIVPILDYVQYLKEDAIRVIESELGWTNYGGKHYESIYTRFYQAYVLPKKFGIDKRRAHNANLVLSGQLARGDALSAMETPTAPSELLADDLEYVCKKLGITCGEFDAIMSLPPKTFHDYPNSYARLETAKKSVRWLRGG